MAANGFKDMTGLRFGRLLVIERAPTENRPHHATAASWKCLCDCGNVTVLLGNVIRRGNTKSCGCLHRDSCRERATKHESRNTGAYRSWSAAKTRCFNRNGTNWKQYGGRGITMSDEWRADFAAFLRDMGPRPAGHSLDRIDNDGPYSADNCRWAPRLAQMNNCRTNHVIEFAGEAHTISEWERRCGFRPGTLKRRLLLNWPVERAFSEPIRRVQPVNRIAPRSA